MPLPRAVARNTEFIRHVATLISGKSLAALITVFAMPVIARLFLPEEFGVAALFVSIVSVVATVAALRYETAIVLPKESADALRLMAFAYRVTLCTCVAVLLVIAAYEVSGMQLAVLELLGVWKWLLPLGILLLSGLHIQESWLTRTKAFKLSSASLVVENAANNGSRIGFGAMLGSSVYGLIIGYLFGMALRLAVQKSASREGIKAALAPMKLVDVRVIARQYADFPKFNAPAGLIFTVGHNLPVLLFGAMFSPTVAGFYAMAHRLAHAPVTIVANATRRVLLQKASAIVNAGGNLHRAFIMSSGGLALVGLPLFVILWLIAEPLTTWFLGERWSVAGQYLQIIVPWLFMIWVMAPCNSVFIVLRAQRFWLVLQMALTGLRLGAFGLAYWVGAGPEWTLRAFVTATVVGNLATMLMTSLVIAQHAAKLRNDAARSVKQENRSSQSAG